jgi:hypothetical protein
VVRTGPDNWDIYTLLRGNERFFAPKIIVHRKPGSEKPTLLSVKMELMRFSYIFLGVVFSFLVMIWILRGAPAEEIGFLLGMILLFAFILFLFFWMHFYTKKQELYYVLQVIP